jgi:hypothetical protein
MLVELYDRLDSTCFTRDIKCVLCRSSNQLDQFGVLPAGFCIEAVLGAQSVADWPHSARTRHPGCRDPRRCRNQHQERLTVVPFSFTPERSSELV